MRQFINKRGLKTVDGLILYNDNKMSIILTKNVESQHSLKHIDVQYYDIRDLVKKKEVVITRFQNQRY